MSIQLTADQEKAKNYICDWFLRSTQRIFVLGGYAGTGKTFLIKHVVTEVLGLKAGEEAVFVSPTGKAASVLIKNGTLATTVHGLIYYLEKEEFETDEEGRVIKNGSLKFVKRTNISDKVRLIVVDETSMVNEDTLTDLLSFGVKCLFCGDNAQLPPINGRCLLLEKPSYTLTEIVRQAKDNPIIDVATRAREGRQIPYGRYGDSVMVVPKSKFFGAERKRLLLKADQILCGTNRTRNALNVEYRQYLSIPPQQKLPVENEKVICVLNDWEKALDEEERFHLVNGTIGTLSKVGEETDMLVTADFEPDFMPRKVRVPFDASVFLEDAYVYGYGDRAVLLADGRAVHTLNKQVLKRVKAVAEETICRFEFAYAITCHKAQGSEFDFVVVFDESRAFGEEANKWLYTAITRAKEKLLIVR